VIITKNTKEIQNIISKYFGNLYSNKLETLERMYNFQNAYNLPVLNQEDRHHLNISIKSNKIEAVIQFPVKEKHWTSRFPSEF
jgi:hypothetical protein